MFLHRSSVIRPLSDTIDIVTCEYPPDIGGVADYTRQVAEGLLAYGRDVRVWTRGQSSQAASGRILPKFSLGAFSARDIWLTHKLWSLDRSRRQILLQWTPTGFGFRGVNLLFALWIAYRVFKGDHLAVTFHEAFYVWQEPKFRLKAASVIQRVMAAVLINSASEVFGTTRNLVEVISNLKMRAAVTIRHLPVPANIMPGEDIAAQTEETTEVSSITMGHFGTYHPSIPPLLIPVLEKILRTLPNLVVVLIGSGSEAYLDSISCDLRDRVSATGVCSSSQVSAAIHSCSFMFQPYPDGLTTRRTSAMAALAHGKLLVSNQGPGTEDVWGTSKSVRFLPLDATTKAVDGLRLLIEELSHTGQRLFSDEARSFYEEQFSIANVIRTLSTSYRRTPIDSSSVSDTI